MAGVGDNDHEAVINALVIDGSSEPRVLTVVRRPSTNIRHPGVVSLPTMRIPRAMGSMLSEAHFSRSTDAAQFAFVNGSMEHFGIPGAGQSLPSLLIEGLFSRKLGAADLLEEGRIRGVCALRLVGEGVVDDPTGTTRTEPTRMYTFVVQVSNGQHLLPKSSGSYSHIRWIKTQLLQSAWRERDGQRLFPSANPFEICIRGLCIRSGIEILGSRAGIRDLIGAVPADTTTG